MDNNNIIEEPIKKKRRIVQESQKEETENTQSPLHCKIAQKQTKVRKKHIPKFRLIPTGITALLSTPDHQRVPLTLTDVQHLLLHSLLGNLNLSQSPRWYVIDKCNHINQTTCLIVEGISVKHWEMYKDDFLKINNIFDNAVEILTPSVYDGSLVKELALVPLSEAEKETMIQKYGSMNLALDIRKDLMVMMKAVFPISEESAETEDIDLEEKFPRTQLILSAWQLIEENYPLPLKGKLKNIYSDYVLSKTEYKPVTAKSPMFGLDCEMCLTNAGSELTRVSIVNEKHETIYESLVKPYNNITDYLTRFSGITKPLLENVSKRLEDVQNEIQDLLPPDSILVGQSVQSDLHALKMMHPYIIDTSTIFNFTGNRHKKPKLKVIARELLNVNIQSGNNGHCSVEDSLAALKLVQLKLSKSIEFGDAVHTNRKQYKENIKNKLLIQPQYALSIFKHIIDKKKSSVIIGCDNITGDYHTFLTQAKESISTQLKKAKPKKVKLNTVDNMDDVADTLVESVADYNLVMGHLKLESDSIDLKLVQKIDEWIEKVWKSLEESSLCVVLFGGTTNDNGIAMVRVKNISQQRISCL